MNFFGILAALAAASAAVAQHGGGDLGDCGLGLELCNRVKAEGMDCCTDRQILIDVLNTMGWQICQEKQEECARGERMQQLARDLAI